jgi:hypothetical protein
LHQLVGGPVGEIYTPAFLHQGVLLYDIKTVLMERNPGSSGGQCVRIVAGCRLFMQSFLFIFRVSHGTRTVCNYILVAASALGVERQPGIVFCGRAAGYPW